MRLTAMTVDGDRHRREQRRPPDPGDHVGVLLGDLEAPVRRRRLDAHAEERQRGDREDRVAEADGQLDDDRALDVREDLADHDEQARLAAQLGGRDVVELALGQDRRPHGAGDDRREQDAHDADDDERRRAQDDERQQRDEDDRQGQERLDDAAQDLVDATAVVAHDQAQQRPGHDPDERRRRGDHEARPARRRRPARTRRDPAGPSRSSAPGWAAGGPRLKSLNGSYGHEPLAEHGADQPEHRR